MKTIQALTPVFVCLLVAACNGKSSLHTEGTAAAAQPPAPAHTAPAPSVGVSAHKPGPTVPATASAAANAAPIPAEATKIFNERCYLCHGKGGLGDGFGGKGMKPPPRNFTDAAWQDSVTDEHVRTIILKGGLAVGKSPTMPPNPDLVGKPEVVDGLMRIVRGFKGASQPKK